MRLLSSAQIKDRLNRTDDYSLFIDPLLEEAQIGDVSVDLRLGTDFLVSILTRKPSIDISQPPNLARGVNSYFRSTRRDIGDRFILYPGQVVLASTLEYIGLPVDIYADIVGRSSLNRLGIVHNTMVQPGFRGCFPLELFNHGNNPVDLVVGGRIVQARLFEIERVGPYQNGNQPRKYFGHVRPVASRAQHDDDLSRLSKIKT